ncbi:MAG: hypothetical protein HZA54_04765, partial [Planctomycetes bacterium]|nr:hypothetical protein [Planctomycetota bacterium]
TGAALAAVARVRHCDASPAVAARGASELRRHAASAPRAETAGTDGADGEVEVVGVGGAESRTALRRRLEECTDPRTMLQLARRAAADADFAAELQLLAEGWAQAAAPVDRVRGLTVLAALDPAAGFDSWQEALARDESPAVRAALLGAPPWSGEVDQDAPLVLALIGALGEAGATAESGAAELQCAALSGLPAELDATAQARLAAMLAPETDPTVWVAATRVLARQSTPAPATIDLLARLGLGAELPAATRREALRGLARAELATPGLLAAELATQVQNALRELDQQPG